MVLKAREVQDQAAASGKGFLSHNGIHHMARQTTKKLLKKPTWGVMHIHDPTYVERIG
jgi:hypothetical protein